MPFEIEILIAFSASLLSYGTFLNQEDSVNIIRQRLNTIPGNLFLLASSCFPTLFSRP